MRKRRNSNDFKAYSANRKCTETYANVNEMGTQRGTRNEHPSRHTGHMRTKFGSVVARADRGTFRAKYKYNGEVITRTFKDRLSAEAWLNSERSRVEADKAGITKWTSPTDRKRQEEAVKRRKTLFCDYVLEEFAPTWLNYATDGSELASGSKRKHREYLAHLSHAFFWKYPLTSITTEDINRWLADLDNFGGATPRKKNVPTSQSCVCQGSGRGRRRKVTRNDEGTGSPEIPTSSNSSRHTGGTANNLCRNARHHANRCVARSHTRPTNRRSGVAASPRLEFKNPDITRLPFRRRERRTKGHENGDEQHDATGSTPARKANQRSVQRQTAHRLHRHMRGRQSHHTQQASRPLQCG